MNLKNIKLRGTVLLLTLMMCMGFAPAAFAANGDVPDTGTELTIATAEELAAFADKINAGEAVAKAVLSTDIDLTDIDWTPIGATNAKAFKGVFDGKGHSVKNLTVSAANIAGLFGYTNGAVIKNLTVTDPTVSTTAVSGTSYAGGVAAYAVNTAFENIIVNYSDSAEDTPTQSDVYTINGYNVLGGIAAWVDGGSFYNVLNYANLKIESKELSKSAAGGIVGYVKGSKTAIANFKYVANYGKLYAEGAATAQNAETNAAAIGGLLGITEYCNVSHSYNAGTLFYNNESDNAMAGGLFGEFQKYTNNNSTASFCYTYGKLDADTYAMLNNLTAASIKEQAFPKQGVIAGTVSKSGILLYVYGKSGSSTYDNTIYKTGNPSTKYTTVTDIIYGKDATDETPLVSLVADSYLKENMLDMLKNVGGGAWKTGKNGYPVFDLENEDTAVYDENNPYQIGSPEQLCSFAAYVNGGHPDAWGVLTADIDMTDAGPLTLPSSLMGFYNADRSKSVVTNTNVGKAKNVWRAIGTGTKYTGTFDGNGFTISNLKFVLPEKGGVTGLESAGLFGDIGAGGVVKNVNVESVSMRLVKSGHGYIAAANEGRIENCKNLGGSEILVSDYSNANYTVERVGGIVGSNTGTIRNCENYQTLKNTSMNYLAGIAASNTGTLEGCSNYADIENRYCVGGITATASSDSCEIIRCFNGGAIRSNNSKASATSTFGATGGIVGRIDTGNIEPLIADCWNSGSISSSVLNTGGIIGTIAGSSGTNTDVYRVRIRNCLNSGNIGNNILSDDSCDKSTQQYLGGIVGDHENHTGVEVTNCLNTGIINGDYRYAAGIIGCTGSTLAGQNKSLPRAAVNYCYSTVNDVYDSPNSKWISDGLKVFPAAVNPTGDNNSTKTSGELMKDTEEGDAFIALLNSDHTNIGDKYEADRTYIADGRAEWGFVEKDDYPGATDRNINKGYPVLLGVGPLTAAPATYTVTYSDGKDGSVFEDQVYENLERKSNTPEFEGKTPKCDGFIFGGWEPAVAETVTKTVTYTATWKADRNGNEIDDDKEPKYTVTYTDGVEDSILFTDQVIKNLLEGDNTPAFAGVNLTRSGYVFTDWMNVDTKVLGVAKTVSGDTVYAAQWSLDRNNNQVPDEEEDTYKVVYEWTGDVPDGDYEQELPEDKTEYLTNESYTLDSKYQKDFIVYTEDAYGNKNGKYTFSGWTDESGCDGIIVDSDITVTGTWSFEEIDVDEYAVEYVWGEIAPEGINPPSDTTVYVSGQSYSVDDTLQVGDVVYTKGEDGYVNAAYTFEGWDSDGGTIEDASVVITGTWTRADIKTLVFKVVNGSWSDGTNDDKVVYVTLTDDAGTLDEDDIPTEMIADENYKAGAWSPEIPTSVDASVASEYIYTFIPDTKNITYPEYNNEDDTNQQDTTSEVLKNKTLTVDPNTGVWAKPDDTWVETENKFVKVVAEDIESIGDPTKDGFTFVGWSETKDNDGNMLLTAHWESDAIGAADENGGDKGDSIPDKYQKKVTFKIVNGTWADGKTEPVVVYLTLTDESSKPSISGTAVLTAPDGMLADADCTGGEWDITPPETVTANMENGAVYTYSFTKVIPEYTLTFNVNGGSEVESVTAPENTVINLGNYTSTKSGSTFTGWYSAADLTDSVSSIVLDSDTTVYAGWRENSGGSGSGSGSGGSKRPSGGGTLSSSTPSGGSGDDTITITDPIVPLAAAPGLNSTDHFAYIIGYEDNTVRPEENITRGEVATIFFRLMTDDFRAANLSDENSFSDVAAGVWYNRAVSTCTKAGLINGNPDGSFAPANDITRAEFAAIAARFLSDEAAESGSFSDISGHWAENDINRAVQAGWIKGKGDGIFAPNDYVTRAEVMTLINRMLNRIGNADAMTDDMVKWVDNPETAWYYADVQEATNGHRYERDALGIGEVWTEIIENRDWTALER